jgi:hypothetical protein
MNFDARTWNQKIQLLCAGEDFNITTPAQYTGNLIAAAILAKQSADEHPQHFKVNDMIRKQLSRWIQQFARYQDFADGCWLLVRYYDTTDLLGADDWTLVELHRRWSNLISLSLYYGNAYQINNFVPFANKVVSSIVAEMLRRKRRVSDKVRHHRPAQWRLDAKQVKANIDMVKVFQNYFPDMERAGKNYRAFCRWHDDDRRRNPNLVIMPEIGACKCYRCGTAFDVFGMIMDLDKVDFATAVVIADRLGN